MLNTSSADSRTTQLGALFSGCWSDCDHPDNTISGTNSAESCSKNRPALRWRASRSAVSFRRDQHAPYDRHIPLPVSGAVDLVLDGSGIASEEAWGTANLSGGGTSFLGFQVIIQG